MIFISLACGWLLVKRHEQSFQLAADVADPSRDIDEAESDITEAPRLKPEPKSIA